jgi:hypothetical protein
LLVRNDKELILGGERRSLNRYVHFGMTK